MAAILSRKGWVKTRYRLDETPVIITDWLTEFQYHHKSIMATQITLAQLLVQQFVQTNKENIRTLYDWPVLRKVLACHDFAYNAE